MVLRCMKKRMYQTDWMPVDPKLFGSLFSFGRVRGLARIFLEIEMILAVAVVGGTLALVFVELVK